MSKIKKAVIPAAGLGKRFLPYSKSQPKEMADVWKVPTIQYVVEEAIKSGIDDITIISSRNKRAIDDHFDKTPHELDSAVRGSNKNNYLKQIEEIEKLLDIATFHYMRQREPKGLGDAVYCARKHIGDEPFVLLLGDTITIGFTPCTKQLMDAHKKYNCSVIAVEKVERNRIKDYGIVKINSSNQIEDLVEKPKPEQAPSNLGIIGRYILTPEIFECIERTKPGLNNEIQLTDALRLLKEQQIMYAYEFKGVRYDIGGIVEKHIASTEHGLYDKEYEGELKKYLVNLAECIPEHEQLLDKELQEKIKRRMEVLRGNNI